MKAIIALGFLVCGLAKLHAAEIRFDGFPDLDSHLKKLQKDFEEKNKGTTLKLLINNHDDHHTKLTSNLATGSGAGDVVAVDVGFLGGVLNAGGFVNLSARPFSVDSWAKHFPSYAFAQGRGEDGHQYAIPLDLGPGVLYYRRDHLKNAGVDIEAAIKSWQSYLNLGKKLQKLNPPVALIGDANDVALLKIYAGVGEGESVFFNQEGKSLLTTQRFIDAVELAKTIRKEGLDLNLNAWTNEWYEALRSAQVATQFSGAWLLGHLKNWIAPKSSGLWGVSPLPDNLYGSWGGTFLAIPKQSSQPNEAFALIQYLVQPEVQLKGLKEIAAFPAHVGTYADPSFNEPIDYLKGQKARQLFAKVAGKIKPIKTFKGDPIARTIFMNALEEAVDQGKPALEVLQTAERFLNRRLRRLN